MPEQKLSLNISVLLIPVPQAAVVLQPVPPPKAPVAPPKAPTPPPQAPSAPQVVSAPIGGSVPVPPPLLVPKVDPELMKKRQEEAKKKPEPKKPPEKRPLTMQEEIAMAKLKKVGAVKVEQKEEKPKAKPQTSMMDLLKQQINLRFKQLKKHLKKKKKEDKVSSNIEEKKQTSTNGTSSSNNTNTTVRERKNIKTKEGKYCGIDTPEELHFFYVNVIQNGKALENNF